MRTRGEFPAGFRIARVSLLSISCELSMASASSSVWVSCRQGRRQRCWIRSRRCSKNRSAGSLRRCQGRTTSVAPASCATAASVVCAALRPSRKSLSEKVAKRSVGWCQWGSHPAPICVPRSFSRTEIDGDEILERRRVGVRHVAADRGRVVGRVLLVGGLQHPRERLRLRPPSSSSPGTRRSRRLRAAARD